MHSGSQEKVPLCHKGHNTLTVGAPALAANLRHGDNLGGVPVTIDLSDSTIAKNPVTATHYLRSRLIQRSAWKKNSPKFKVASSSSDAAAIT
jgi:hypothetical protein